MNVKDIVIISVYVDIIILEKLIFKSIRIYLIWSRFVKDLKLIFKYRVDNLKKYYIKEYIEKIYLCLFIWVVKKIMELNEFILGNFLKEVFVLYKYYIKY